MLVLVLTLVLTLAGTWDGTLWSLSVAAVEEVEEAGALLRAVDEWMDEASSFLRGDLVLLMTSIVGNSIFALVYCSFKRQFSCFYCCCDSSSCCLSVFGTRRRLYGS